MMDTSETARVKSLADLTEIGFGMEQANYLLVMTNPMTGHGIRMAALWAVATNGYVCYFQNEKLRQFFDWRSCAF